MLLRRADDQFDHMIAAQADGARIVANLIDAAEFDENDRDIGTAGLCGTFAIALHTVLQSYGIAARPKLAYIGALPKDWRRIHWRHAVLEVDGKLFDVDGHVEPAHVLDNYCWKSPDARGFHQLTFSQFSSLIKTTRNAFDVRWLTYWSDRLKNVAIDQFHRP